MGRDRRGDLWWSDPQQRQRFPRIFQDRRGHPREHLGEDEHHIAVVRNEPHLDIERHILV
jgi:hypothetical protein